jgi:hypothetical protein
MSGFDVLDSDSEISASETRLWSENVAGRVVLCASITFPGK